MPDELLTPPAPALEMRSPKKLNAVLTVAILTFVLTVLNSASLIRDIPTIGTGTPFWFSMVMNILWLVASYGVGRRLRLGTMLYTLLAGAAIAISINTYQMQLLFNKYMPSHSFDWSGVLFYGEIALIVGALAILWRKPDSFK